MVEDFLVSLLFFIKKLLIKLHIFRIDPRLPSIIAIGDSWLNLTLFDWRKYRKHVDTIDFLRDSHKFNIIDCAIPGYKIADEVKHKLFRTAITQVPGDFVILMSFGGNDLTLNFERYIRGFGNKAKLNRKLLRRAIRLLYLKYLKLYLDLIYLEIHSMNAQTNRDKIKQRLHIMIHGYQAFRPEIRENGKLHERFEKLTTNLKIPEKLATKLANEFVEVTNIELLKFTRKTINLHYIDLRNIEISAWSDALHPAPSGFSKIANKFLEEISRITLN